jgi:hypothetical protein
MIHKDLEIIDIINDQVVYSIGLFNDKVPTSSKELLPQFKNKILEYCFDFKYCATSLPSQCFNCYFCDAEVDFSNTELAKNSSQLVWLKLDKSIFAFPGILYHLIIVHKYVPPVEFIDTVMNPLSKTILLISNDENVTRSNKETMEMLLARHNSSKENVESKVVKVGDISYEIVWKKPETLKDKVKRFFKKK